MDSERYVNELLQNADDCTYANDVKPTFELKISEDFRKIVTQYNEIGFSIHNVRAITSIGESTKKKILNSNGSNTEIGEKGVGFKSVFAVARRVNIHSGDFHFVLTSEAPTVPKLFKEEKQHDEEERWAPVGCDTPKAVTDHEMGHEIDKLLDASSDVEIQRMYAQMMEGNPEEQLSGYSAENVKEFIAEAYSEYKNNPNPRQIAVDVYNRLIELRDMKNDKGDDYDE
jgi:hypothetical protein